MFSFTAITRSRMVVVGFRRVFSSALVSSMTLLAVGAAGCGSEEDASAVAAVDRSTAAELVRRDVISTMPDPRRTLALMVPEPVRAGSAVADLSASASLAGRERGDAASIQVERDSWLVYIDPSPWLRFAHAVKWAFVDLSSGQVRVEDASSWPVVDGKGYFAALAEDEVRANLVHPLQPTLSESESLIPPEVLDAKPEPGALPSQIRDHVGDPRCGPDDPPPTTYALLVQAGSRGDMDDDSTSMATAWSQRLPASQVRHVRSGLSADVMTVLQSWAPKVRCCDTLFLYIVGHGPWPKDQTPGFGEVLVDEGWPGGPGEITQLEVAAWAAAVEARHVEIYIDSCFGGHFVTALPPAMAKRKADTRVKLFTSASSEDTSIASPLGTIAAIFGGGQGYSSMTRGFADAIYQGADFSGAVASAKDASAFTTAWSHPQTYFFETPGEAICGGSQPGDDAGTTLPDSGAEDAAAEDGVAPDAADTDASSDAGATDGSSGDGAVEDASVDAGDSDGSSLDASEDATGDTGDSASSSILMEACSELPGDFSTSHPWTPGPGENVAVVCIEPGDICRVSNDTYEDQPLAPTQCSAPLGHRALNLGIGTTEPFAQAGPGWRSVWTSYGEVGSSTARPRFNLDESLIGERETDQARFRFDFRPQTTSFRVDSVSPFSGPLPPYGQSFDCSAAPMMFTDPHVDGLAKYFARICIGPSAGDCRVHGNVEATAEQEICASGPYAITLGYSDAVASPFAGGGWSVVSSTHGTVDADYVLNFPSNVEVTVIIGQGTSYAVRFIWTGAAFNVLSVNPI